VNKQLHPHQQLAFDLIRRSLGTGHKRPMVQAPTGFGKTLLATKIIESALAKGNRTYFVVPSISLIDQTVQSLWAEDIRDIGVIQGRHPLTNYAAPVQVCSVQTLSRRGEIPHGDVVIVDEAHEWHKHMAGWMAEWDRIPFIGLSATPWTKGLGQHYDDLIIAETTQGLIDRGYLSPFRVYAPSAPDLRGVKTVAGDWDQKQVGERMDTPALTADIVATWLKIGENRPTLCYAVNRAHAKHLTDEFNRSGIPCGYIDAYTDLPEREIIKQKFHNGELKVVLNVGCLTKGIDWDVRCIILARPTKSEMLFVQIVGRGLRTANGKADCLILDHSDTHQRLGFVTDIHHERLCDGKLRETTAQAQDEQEPALPKPCPACHVLKPPKIHVCPACGFAPERKQALETREGELIEITRAQKLHTKTRDKQQVYSELLAMARERGRSEGWVAHSYRAYFGVWPRNVTAVERTPSQETRDYVRGLDIRFAKRRVRAA